MEKSLTETPVQTAESGDDVSRTGHTTRVSDSRDQEIESHITCFLKNVSRTLRMAPMTLDSPESARAALAEIHELQRKVKAHRATAQALTRLIISDTPPALPAEPVFDSRSVH